VQTLLSRFCEDLGTRMRPLSGPLEEFAALLERPEGAPLADLVPPVAEYRRRLRSLLEKLREQQSYVILFGPLKSGKSTLMNAFAEAWVSEVTALPAYPCMVYVAHDPSSRFTVTRYDGSKESFESLAAMREVMSRAHAELAAGIRAVEAHGGEFDPAQHMPTALRRIDVGVPADALARSGAVLVDTPGLYSRMKFGYDQLTREFRDAAAVAVFVVKTENLFLEQVFDEFADLLRLFSKIFLVVNLDGAGRDLQPDGRLGPSLESRDPQRILQAFDDLAMNEDLRAARTSGRLQIYPVDLLEAASQRLRGEQGEGEPAFGVLQSDLVRYLNSADYLQAFLGDSLRQAADLLSGLEGLSTAGAVVSLAERRTRLADESREAEQAAASLQRVEAFGWEETLARMREDVARIMREETGDLRKETAAAAEAALARWYDGDASFAALINEDLEEVLVGARTAVVARAHEVSATVLASDVAASMTRRDIESDLDRLGLSIANISRRLEGSVRTVADHHPVTSVIPTRIVPVRRGLLDWLFLRSLATVRRRLFGPEDAPLRPIPLAVKQRRLAAGRVALAEAIRRRVDLFFSETLSRISAEVFGSHVAAVTRQVRERLEVLASEGTARRADLGRQLAAVELLHARVGDLEAAIGEGVRSFDSIKSLYERTPAGPAPGDRRPGPEGPAGGRALDAGSVPGATGSAAGGPGEDSGETAAGGPGEDPGETAVGGSGEDPGETAAGGPGEDPGETAVGGSGEDPGETAGKSGEKSAKPDGGDGPPRALGAAAGRRD
jgi:hypothetical protein